VAKVIPVDVSVAGCPPAPIDILRGILQAVKLRPAGARRYTKQGI
jgi:Ni,Fe-hydrogenase III small subunit